MPSEIRAAILDFFGAAEIDAQKRAGTPWNDLAPHAAALGDRGVRWPAVAPGVHAFTVAMTAIPPEWEGFFEFDHEGGCRRIGTKQVKGAGWKDSDVSAEIGYHGGVAGCGHHYGGSDGTEEVAAYECAPGCPVGLMDEQSGCRKSSGKYHHKPATSTKGFRSNQASLPETHRMYDDQGTSSRFFHSLSPEAPPFIYQAKASKRDRGLDNKHTTVKPRELIRLLCRLVTPPGGTVLDPFVGSGTTVMVAIEEGFHGIGIELAAESVVIARSRCEAAEEACISRRDS